VKKVSKIDRTGSKGINKRILKNGDIPGDTTTWRYPLSIPYLSQGDIP